MEINKLINMGNLFYECESLSSLPDISIWNINNIINIQGINQQYISLLPLRYIEKLDKH